MALLRTEEMTDKYKEHQESHSGDSACALCAKDSIQEFTHFRIVNNDFPYDRIAQEHHMLISMRHTSGEDLTEEEYAELFQIKSNVDTRYDFIIESTMKNKSVPAHYHLHLVVIKS